ncbi:hypothetical protein, partial [Enterobacter cloacae complex sp. 2DZ2F20B]|uniref:hypothetical protein n=1 Tax=Enterobacter cloacae complex sp. 2DZ2F20B TaxID=2511993 RepID=UPI001CA4E84E
PHSPALYSLKGYVIRHQSYISKYCQYELELGVGVGVGVGVTPRCRKRERNKLFNKMCSFDCSND